MTYTITVQPSGRSFEAEPAETGANDATMNEAATIASMRLVIVIRYYKRRA